jgi:predicted Zn-dependent protease
MEEAAKFYTELLEIEPENQRYLLNVAEALVQSEQFEEALQYLHKAHYLDPTSTPVTLQLSWCLICNGQKEKAMKLVLDLRAEDPQNTEAQTLFALVLLIDGQMREAYNQIRLVIDDNNKDDILDRLSTLGHLDLVSYDKELLFTDALALNID